MQVRHVPRIDARYWAGIVFASIFGTNLGDFYAHESGLGLLGGLPILILLFAAVFVAEKYENRSHEAYYWACILIMRTGATNIADYLAGHGGLNIDRGLLCVIFALAIAGLAWWSGLAWRSGRAWLSGRSAGAGAKTVPDTGALYWVAMLLAGIFGTVMGDLCEHVFGRGAAAIGLALVLALVLAVYARNILRPVHAYWLTIAVARTAGTALGDWLAENHIVELGLPLSTLLTGLAFFGIVALWRPRRPAEALVSVS